MSHFPPRLLIISNSRNIRNFTTCKISINKSTKKLIVAPRKKGSKKVEVSFKRKFIYTKNILCALNCAKDTNYYIFILQSEATCKKIFDAVQKLRDIDAHSRYRYRKQIEKLLRDAKVRTKISDNVYQVAVDEKNELILRQNNKRRFADRDSGSDSSERVSPSLPKSDYIMMKKIYESPYFEKVVAERRGVLKPRLLIFPNNDKMYHFEYYWLKGLQCYQCCGCHMKAVIAVNANGTEYVEHRTTTKHFCSLRKYDPAKYTVDVTTRIVENHNFKVIKYTQKGITSSKLFIFDPSKKNLCRGYIWDKDNEYYLCIGCNSESQRIFARICKNVDGNEYLMLSKNEHVCDLREFNSDKYKDDIIVKKPMFQHVEQKVAGEKRKYLLIFTANDQKFYYKFSYENGYLPICSKCTQKNLYIQAYVLTDDDGNEYVSVRNKEHICKPLEYNSSDFEDNQIIKPPGYQVIKRNWRGKFVEKLVVFDSTDKSLCYEYTLQQTKKTKRYKCNECHHKHSTCVIAWIINQRKENEHVELSKIQHKCKLIKFEDPNSTIIHSPNFKIIKCVRKAPSGIPKDHLFVYSSLESKLCYRYYSDSGRNHFICHECAYKKKIMVSARLHKNENGEDFVQLGGNKHVCEPQPEKSVLKKMSRFLEILN